MSSPTRQVMEHLRTMLAAVESRARFGDIDGAQEALRRAGELLAQMPGDEAYEDDADRGGE